jgi:hypothetical protein
MATPKVKSDSVSFQVKDPNKLDPEIMGIGLMGTWRRTD